MLDISRPDWIEKAHCLRTNMPTRTFFERWERGDSNEKKAIENTCINLCPVTEECLSWGLSTYSSGLYGGVYLENGKRVRGGRRRGYLEDKRDQKSRDNRVA